MFKSLKFDNVDSLDYGVHINGEGVYNAPERDVEMISIPGRNGEYALDHGRFNNIEVTYPAGIGEMSQTDFADKLSAFRNQLASRKGYCRLEDGYHPDEFRMGVYKSGLEASPVMYNRAGEFDLVFNCKPQRFLKTGEQATEFTQDGTINNPTLFESKPLLELYGYGTLNVNGSEIVLHNEPLGTIELLPDLNSDQAVKVFKLPSGLYNTGDVITLNGASYRATFTPAYGVFVNAQPDASVLVNMSVTRDIFTGPQDHSAINVTVDMTDISFVAGTSKECSYSRTFQYTVLQHVGLHYTYTVIIRYDGNDTITVYLDQSSGGDPVYLSVASRIITTGALLADSTVLPLGSPLYLDCEIGEAYKEENGQITLINKNVDIPSDLPVLSPGENQIVMDDTFTRVNVIPRWWII